MQRLIEWCEAVGDAVNRVVERIVCADGGVGNW